MTWAAFPQTPQQGQFLPKDTLEHWWSVKQTITRQRDVNGGFRGQCEDAMLDANRLIVKQDSTIDALVIIASNDSTMNADCRRQYNDLDRRTVKKSSLPWWVLAGAIIGYLLGTAK